METPLRLHHSCFCAYGGAHLHGRPPPSSRSPPTLPKRASPSPPPPPPLLKKRHWKEGEFPAVSFPDTTSSRRPPLKNIKKKLDDRVAARAWAPTVTEALSDRIQKRQWEDALQVSFSPTYPELFYSK